MHSIIILLGAQGSGKGTVAAELMAAHEYDYIETGTILRGLDRDDPANKVVVDIMNSGALVPDEIICELVAARLSATKDILTDGFPRSEFQAKWLLDWAAAHGFAVRAVLLNIPDETIMARIQNRIAEGAGRADDADPAAIAKRVATYHATTMPMIKFLRNAPGVKFVDIDATQPVEKVFADVKGKI